MDGDVAAGAIIGFRPPARPDSLFVWQIAVSADHRGAGLGRRMLAWLMEANADRGVRYLEATVTPDNEPSQRMFRGFASAVGAGCEESLLFPARAFPGTGEQHAEEWLFRIGPVERQALQPLMQQRVPTPGGTKR